MAEPDPILDIDFDSQLRGLFQEAEAALSQKPSAGSGATSAASAVPATATPAVGNPAAETTAAPGGNSAPKAQGGFMPQMLRPLLLGLEAVTRATGENTNLLQKLTQAGQVDAEAREDLPKLVAELRGLLEMKNGLNQSMFSALHEELRGYKDAFLLESVHRPVIRDLITLYDDLAEIRRQLVELLEQGAPQADEHPAARFMFDRNRTMAMNLEHNLEFILEVLARLEVSPIPPGTGKLDKQTQRAIALEAAQSPEEDGLVVRSVKRGFYWKERVLRAEEVIMKRWRNRPLSAEPAAVVS